MKKSENQKEQNKSKILEDEKAKLIAIFQNVEESKRSLANGLIQDAAFLYAENYILRKSLEETGMIKIHPQHKEMQKLLPAAGQYLKNINSYSIIIKTLNGILSKDMLEIEDENLTEYE